MAMYRLILALCTVVLSGLLVGPPSFAHQQKEGLTTVYFNPRTQHIEVMHRIYMHDAEHAVKTFFDNQADILKDPLTQETFARYVSDNFSLTRVLDSANNLSETLPLDTVGYEVEGRFFWVYQETPKPAELGVLRVSHDVLRDIWPEQTNLINFEGLGAVRSLTFAENVSLLEVAF